MVLRIFVVSALLATCLSLRIRDNPAGTIAREFQTDSGSVTLLMGKKKGRAINLAVPEPFEVKSKLLTIGDSEASEPKAGRRGRQMQTFSIDEKGIPVIEGVRSPDDPSDTRVFRNARVINNVLVTDDDDEQNQISFSESDQETKKESATMGRQARILTGPVEYENNEKESASSANYEFPPYYYKAFYDPDRSGLPGQTNPNRGSSNDEEKIVSYSYSTSGGGVQKKSPRDVVYGSGFAEDPSNPPKPAAAAPRFSTSNSNFSPPKIQNQKFVVPSSFSTGFSPMSSSQVRAPLFQSNERNPIRSPLYQSNERNPIRSPNVELPGTNTVSIPFSSFLGSSSSGVKYVNNNIAPNLPPPLPNQQSDTRFPPWNSQNSQNSNFQHSLPNVNTNFGSSPFNPPQLQTNQIRRRQQQSSAPTPHQAFGSSAGSLIHPGIIPASSGDFIIEDATFQTHPGAPAFSVPVPRPAHQSNAFATPEQQQIYNHPNHYPEYPYYQQGNYIEEIDNRPLIDKMMDPFRRVGERVREIASPVINPVLLASHRLGNRFRIPERVDKIGSGILDTDAIPLVGGAVAVATLGALGAYAATKYSFDDLKRLLPSTAKRSSKSNANVADILVKLADDLESEEPSFLNRFSSSTAWLESSCSKRIFCTLVTSTISEEENKILRDEKKLGEEGEEEEEVEADAETQEEQNTLRSREARRFLDREITYIEKQINALIDGIRNPSSNRESKLLRDAAKSVVEAVKQRNCSVFACSKRK